MAKRRRSNSNRFKQPPSQKFLSFDPIRQNLFKVGLVAGALGGLFFIPNTLFWQVIGFLIIFFISNYYVNKAAQLIPRWHAIIFSLVGAMLAMMVVITIGTIVLTLNTA